MFDKMGILNINWFKKKRKDLLLADSCWNISVVPV